MLTRFKYLKFVKSFAVIYSSHSLLMNAQRHIIEKTITEKTRRIGLKTWN